MYVLFMGVLVACSDKLDNTKRSDFDLVCDYFQELREQKNIDKMTFVQRNGFIEGKITKALPGSYVKDSWEAISSAVPEDRYEIFKMGAEEVLGLEWSCSAMKILAPITGVVE